MAKKLGKEGKEGQEAERGYQTRDASVEDLGEIRGA